MKIKSTVSLLCALPAAVLAVGMAPPAFSAEQPSAYVKPNFKHASYGDLRVVVALTSDDHGIQGMKLRNIANALKAVDEWKGHLTVKVVLYAKGLTLLKNPEEGVQKQLDALRARGVQFEVCNNSLSEQGVDFHALYGVTDADIVPSGFAEVAYLQAKQRFVVDPVN